MQGTAQFDILGQRGGAAWLQRLSSLWITMWNEEGAAAQRQELVGWRRYCLLGAKFNARRSTRMWWIGVSIR